MMYNLKENKQEIFWIFSEKVEKRDRAKIQNKDLAPNVPKGQNGTGTECPESM